MLVSLALLSAAGHAPVLAFGPEAKPTHSIRHQDRTQLDAVLTPLLRSQNQQGQFRSRSEVMREVKQRYDAKVLKISLNKAREVYNVRVLMPSGKVRNIQVSARR